MRPEKIQAVEEIKGHFEKGSAAVFLDSARVTRRMYSGDRNDVDLGGGLRVSLGGGGSLRVDYGHGLIHDDDKFSVDFEF